MDIINNTGLLMDEVQIIAGCKQGEARAQKLLFEKYATGMLVVCTRYVKNNADAEELLLNGFYKFFTQADKFVYSGGGSIAAYLRKIMVNECLMFLRKKGQLILMDETMAEQVMVDEQITERMSADELFMMITELPSGYRTVFNMYVIDGMGHKEIAEELGITEGTSKSQLNRARIMLQKIILKKGGYRERQQ